MATARQRRLPEFIAVGPARTGTTWLHAALEEVAWLPHQVKETHFFAERYHKGIDWYAEHFRFADNTRPIGEVCTYFNFSAAIEHIAEHLPDCKIVCTLRDPVDRAYSEYRLKHRYDVSPPGFEEALLSTGDRVIYDGNRYGFYLRKWRERFGKDRVMAAVYDDLLRLPQLYVNRICEFIGARSVPLEGRNFNRFEHNAAPNRARFPHAARLSRLVYLWLMEHDAYAAVNFLRRLKLSAVFHSGGSKYPSLQADEDARVRAMFRPEIEELEEMIGRDLSAWKYGPGHRANDTVIHDRMATAS